jgi:hypothetical protein
LENTFVYPKQIKEIRSTHGMSIINLLQNSKGNSPSRGVEVNPAAHGAGRLGPRGHLATTAADVSAQLLHHRGTAKMDHDLLSFFLIKYKNT